MEDFETARWDHLGDYFDVSVCLAVWMPDVQGGSLEPISTRNVYRHLMIDNCIECILMRDAMFACARGKFNCHTYIVAE